MSLSKQVVMELLKLRTEIETLQAKEQKLTAKCKKEMVQEEWDEFAPRGCQFKFVLNEHERASVGWKSEWKKLAKKVFGKKWKRKEEELIEESKAEVISLLIKPNV